MKNHGTFSFLLFLCLNLFSAEVKAQEQTFSLSGLSNEFEDGTYLYLHDVFRKKSLDSAVVRNGKFKFATKLPESPIWVMISLKNRSAFRSTWLVNNEMTLNSMDTDFKDAVVTGSAPDDLEREIAEAFSKLPEEEMDEMIITKIKENPENIIAAYQLHNYKNMWGRALTEELFQILSEENKNNIYGKEIATFLKEDTSPQIGEKYVDFSLPTPGGESRSFSEMEGKIVLLEFWASWCGPCRKENPNLVRTFKKYNKNGFEVFAVSLDRDKTSWVTAIEKDGLLWPQVSDLKKNNAAALVYGVSPIPDNFLINRDGIIIGRALSNSELNEKLEELIQSEK